MQERVDHDLHTIRNWSLMLDVKIGAHALVLGATLATNNVREFSRIKGLTVVDWLESRH